jgi:hypothetical protein
MFLEIWPACNRSREVFARRSLSRRRTRAISAALAPALAPGGLRKLPVPGEFTAASAALFFGD